MTRKLIILVSITVLCFSAGSSFGAVFGDGGSSLQGALNNITVAPSPTPGLSSTNVLTDDMADYADSVWSISGSGGSISTIVIEIAALASTNTFGIYDATDPSKKVEIFAGAAGTGAQAKISILFDGSVEKNFVDTGIDFAGNQFGFYLDSITGSPNGGGGIWYSDTAYNSDGLDHMYAYQGTGIDTVQILPYAPGVWGNNEYVLAFEDLDAASSDLDYSDFVAIVESINPVPVPAAIWLGMLGLSAAGCRLRRKRA
jgi:hypothetical protein